MMCPDNVAHFQDSEHHTSRTLCIELPDHHALHLQTIMLHTSRPSCITLPDHHASHFQTIMHCTSRPACNTLPDYHAPHFQTIMCFYRKLRLSIFWSCAWTLTFMKVWVESQLFHSPGTVIFSDLFLLQCGSHHSARYPDSLLSK